MNCIGRNATERRCWRLKSAVACAAEMLFGCLSVCSERVPLCIAMLFSNTTPVSWLRRVCNRGERSLGLVLSIAIEEIKERYRLELSLNV